VIYLDNNATTRPDDEVIDLMNFYLREEFGNSGSISHSFGSNAKKAVEQSRSTIASYIGAMPSDIIFTSGATEANNIAILGLCDWLLETRGSVVTAQVEHKAVLEPAQRLEALGIDVIFIPPEPGNFARLTPEHVLGHLPPNPGLVSFMWANNETGCVSDIEGIAAGIKREYPSCLIHSDCTQGLGKLDQLDLTNIDMISASGHKIYGPKGIGFLYINRHARKKVKPLTYGGGQERSLSPGTQPVFLIAGLGKSVELCEREFSARQDHLRQIRGVMTEVMNSVDAELNSSLQNLPNTMNLYLPGRDAEAMMIKLKDYFAVSSGSACTSATFEPSHVLKAIFVSEVERWSQSLRFSWSHQTPAFEPITLSRWLA